MKRRSVIIVSLVLCTALFSCESKAEKKVEENANSKKEIKKNSAKAVNHPIIAAESTINCSGELLGIVKHSGIVKVVKGNIELKGNQISGGNFVVDMQSILPTDDKFDPEKGQTPEKLASHLKSDDFFKVDSFPEASFDIISFNPETNSLIGKLTIRGISKEEMVKNVLVDTTNMTASGTLKFNRQDYNVAFEMSAKDMIISDDINLNISLKMR